MQLRPVLITTLLLLSFILIGIVTPCFSEEMLDSEIYEIDYRGPETHSSVTPPDHVNGSGRMSRRPWIHPHGNNALHLHSNNDQVKDRAAAMIHG